MEKVICFGAGNTAKNLYKRIAEQYEVIAFADNQESKHGQFLMGKEIISPDKIKDYNYDYLIVTALTAIGGGFQQLIDLGVDKSKIITSYVSYPIECKIEWLRSLSQLHNIYISNAGAEVAEAGVFQGEYAQYINKFYPNRILHLFDTFEGYSKFDIEKENGLSTASTGHLSATSEDIVKSKMSYPEKVIIHKGYFPKTAEGITSSFCFVNLDMDLYQPTLEGLRFFAPKMVKGGVILIHDYFNSTYEKSVKKAVNEFMEETELKNLRLVPNGDTISIAVVGF